MPLLLAIGGHTGTGKSTLAYLLGRDSLRGALILDMDQSRREMLGLGLAVNMRAEDYAPEVTARVRARMDAEISAALGSGRDVIDASGFFMEDGREAIETLAARCGAVFIGLWLVAPREVMEARIGQRLAERARGEGLSVKKGHASDACVGVIDKFGDIGLPSSKKWVVLRAERDLETVMGDAMAVLARGDDGEGRGAEANEGDWRILRDFSGE